MSQFIDRDELRQLLRLCRQTLSSSVRARYSRLICQQIKKTGLITENQHIALYMPKGSEVDVTPLINYVAKSNAFIYLPVLPPEGRILSFSSLKEEGKWQENHLGITEWLSDALVPAQSLDIVFTPLLGFDGKCHRLGQGGGYYDATFAFLKEQHPVQKPKLFGVAFDCQKFEPIPFTEWDVPLDGVFTETTFYSQPKN